MCVTVCVYEVRWGPVKGFLAKLSSLVIADQEFVLSGLGNRYLLLPPPQTPGF